MTDSFELHEATIAQLAAAYDSRALSVEEVVAEYVRRIEAIDRGGDGLHSVLEVNLRAAEAAAKLQREREASGPRSALHGVPLLVKDNVDTADGMHTTAGSLALMASMPAAEAPAVRQLKAAGAVVLGKTNMSEWANFRSDHSVSGWSGRGGLTRNPYVLDRSPCGSSSGSGAAVAANLAMTAVGTETDGSVVCPSSICGVVGIKPTVGLVSRAGVIPISPTQDSVGVHARTVMDAALTLDAMVDRGAFAAATASYATDLDSASLAGVRLGVLRDHYVGYSQHADCIFETALAALRDAGAMLVDPMPLASAAELARSEAEMTLLTCEFKDAINAYLGARRDPEVADLSQLIAFNEAHAAEEMGWFGQERLLAAQASGGLQDPRYGPARAECEKLGREALDAALEQQRLDGVVALTAGPAWTVDPINGDHSLGGSSQLAALAGYPVITVPAGHVAGELPVGVSFMAGALTEARLIRIAFAFERATAARRAPGFRRSLGA